MQTRADDTAFVFDAIHRLYRINKVKLWVEFTKVVGWEITDTKVNYLTMEVDLYGRKDKTEEEELIPDYPSDLEALRFAIVESKMVIGPEFSFFEKKNVPIGFAVYKNWDHIAVDHIDRVGSKSALALSQDINVAIMLAYMCLRNIKVDLEGLR